MLRRPFLPVPVRSTPVFSALRWLLLTTLGLGLARPAAAQACLNNFALVGTAEQHPGYYQLTQSGRTNVIGAMWSANTIDLAYDFDFTFTVNQCGGADGLLFVLHRGGPAASSGEAGGAMGYYAGTGTSFAQSVAVELDTYDNSTLNNGLPFADTDGSHLVLVTNANPQPVQGPVAVSPALGSCRDRVLHLVWEAATHRLSADLDGVRQVTYAQDLVNVTFGGQRHVTFGFIGSTGGQTSTQTIAPGVLTAGGPAPTIGTDGPTTFCAPGAVTLRVAGQPAGTTYAWSPATGLSGTTTAAVLATPTATTTYAVAITTPNGCTTQGGVTVTVRPPLRVAAGGAQVVCAGQAAQLTAASPGGVGVSYRWAPATGLNAPLGDTVVATPAATTLYTVTASTPEGCVARDTVRVVVRPPVPVDAGPDRFVRPGRAVRLRVVPQPGLSYAWTPFTGLFGRTGPVVWAGPAVTTRYTVTATDSATGCTGQATVLVEVSTLLPVSISPDQLICPGGSTTLTATTPPWPGVRYAWSPATGLSATTGATVVAAPTVPTTYTVTATDSAGYTGQATVRVSPAPAPALAPQARLLDQPARRVAFSPGPAAGTATAYRWDFGDGSAPDPAAAPTHAYPQPGPYRATLVVSYGPGCTAEAAVTVDVPAFEVPNIITPNHDGANDAFDLGPAAGGLDLRVYTRWGRLVFEQNPYRGGWSADQLPAGTYYYHLTAAGGGHWQGWVEVVR